jgi:hypothetical protein
MNRNRGLWLVIIALVLLAVIPARADAPMRGMGALPSPNVHMRTYAEPLSTQLPQVVDLSAGLPRVGDQGFEQSCTYWATAYYYATLQAHNGMIFSPTFLASMVTPCRGDQAVAMHMVDVMAGMLRGASSIQKFPIDAWCATPSSGDLRTAARYRMASYGALSTDVNALRAHLAGGDAFVAVVPVTVEWCSLFWRRGQTIQPPRAGLRVLGYHAVCVVGYDDSRQAFRFVNSWGAGWGDGGFAWLSYRFVDACLTEAWCMTPMVNTKIGGNDERK